MDLQPAPAAQRYVRHGADGLPVVNGANPADGADFVGGILPSGLIGFAAGEISKLLTIYVAGDATAELANSFTVTLVNPLEGLNLVTESAAGMILDGDLKAYDDAYVILQGRALTAAAVAVEVLANDETVPPETVAQLSGVAHGQLQLGVDGETGR